MQIYSFTPPIEPTVCLSGNFTDDEIAKIVDYCDRQQFMEGRVGNREPNGEELPETRNSQISWIHQNQDTDWFFIKIAETISRINFDKYRFDLSYFEVLQYTTYKEGGLYDWHIDAIDNQAFFGPGYRKLSISILLSEPEKDFTGGEFQVIHGGDFEYPINMEIKKGDILTFPSYVPHKVNTVLTGKRKSLVAWVLGPAFK